VDSDEIKWIRQLTSCELTREKRGVEANRTAQVRSNILYLLRGRRFARASDKLAHNKYLRRPQHSAHIGLFWMNAFVLRMHFYQAYSRAFRHTRERTNSFHVPAGEDSSILRALTAANFGAHQRAFLLSTCNTRSLSATEIVTNCNTSFVKLCVTHCS
jgi:hypothetical protein